AKRSTARRWEVGDEGVCGAALCRALLLPPCTAQVSLAAFGVHSAMGYSLTAAIAFPALALFNLLRFPIIM
ncbi:MAG: hypothetical protein ACT6T3_21895, partial [Agrobacterium sp.]|uniref:hypothetical protein n=1 Tax=Agrobacterium sp. TaxID=361 RepID=UPI0040346B46